MIKKIISIFLSLGIGLSLMPGVWASEEAIEIHVSVSGESTGTGSEKNPVDSLENARKLVLKRKLEKPDVPINVIFHGGTYRFTSGVKMTDADSGSEKGPITYMAADGEKVYFKGSSEIDLSKIKLVEDAKILAKLPRTSRGKVGYIDLAEQGFENLRQMPTETSMYYTHSAYEYAEIYLDGNQQTMARWPNGENGYTQMASVVSKGGTGVKGVGGIFETKDYRLMNWVDAKDAWIVGFLNYDWAYDRIPIKSIDVEKKQITLKHGSIYGLSMSHSYRYAIINLLEELDVPGEYYIDHDKNILYYYPEKSLKGATMEILTLEDDLIRMDGVKNVNFKGINFEQAMGCAIKAYDKLENVSINNCVFNNIGRYGIWHFTNKQSQIAANTTQASQYRENGLENVHVDNNAFYNIGLSSFKVYCGSRDKNKLSGCTFNNNYLYHIGTFDRKSTGFDVYGVGVEIANNTIHECGYGMNYIGSDMNIHSNEIYNVMKSLNDGSAIYSGRNFINRNNKIYENYLHDIVAKDPLIKTTYSHGIYWDDMDSGNEAYRNIIVGANNAIVINCGMSNNVHDNIFVNSTEQGVYISTYGMGGEASIVRQTTQGEMALQNPDYERFHEEIRADIDSGMIALPARNTLNNNITLNSDMTYNDMITGYNNIGTSYEVLPEAFVDAEKGDYRIKKSENKTDALDEEFDMRKIGIDASDFAEEPVKRNDFLLTYPRNGTTGIDTSSQTFSWQRSIGADRYRFVLAKDHELKNIVEETYLYETTHTVDNLEPNTTYYWKVYVENESLGDYDAWESLGVNYMFKTANYFVEDNTDLLAARIAAEAKLKTIVEGEEIGQYRVGTRAMLEEKLKLLEKEIKNPSLGDKEKAELIADIESIYNSDDFIIGGYIEMGDLIPDKQNWIASDPISMVIDENVITAGNKDTGVNFGYSGIYEASRVVALQFKLKVDFNIEKPEDKNSHWFAMGLRGKNLTNAVYAGGNDQYFMLMKEGILEYQRNSGGTNSLIETITNEDVKSGEWMDIDFGVVNLGDVGQLTILKINGEVAYQAVDCSENMVLTKGGLEFMLTKGVDITIAPSEREIGSFEELVDEYTLKMTEDFCNNILAANDNEPIVILRSDSKKAFYNNTLQDISVPITGEGEDMLMSLELAKDIFEDVGNVKVTDVNGVKMIKVMELVKALNKKHYFHEGKMIFIMDALNMHTANYGEIINGTSNSMALYQ